MIYKVGLDLARRFKGVLKILVSDDFGFFLSNFVYKDFHLPSNHGNAGHGRA